jgi:hypothetical protein
MAPGHVLVGLFGLVVIAPATAPAVDVSGWWYVRDTVQTSDYRPFVGLELGYRIYLEQEGMWIFGRGEKSCENGRPLPSDRRTSIAIAGTTEGDALTVRLIEDGRRRRTAGTFAWTIAPEGHRLVGTFTATAGNSRGRSVAEGVQEKPPACGGRRHGDRPAR